MSNDACTLLLFPKNASTPKTEMFSCFRVHTTQRTSCIPSTNLQISTPVCGTLRAAPDNKSYSAQSRGLHLYILWANSSSSRGHFPLCPSRTQTTLLMRERAAYNFYYIQKLIRHMPRARNKKSGCVHLAWKIKTSPVCSLFQCAHHFPLLVWKEPNFPPPPGTRLQDTSEYR